LCSHKGPADRSQQHLANERTFLSWLRTYIALIGLGFIVARFGLFLREFGLVAKNANNNAAVSPFGNYQSSLIGISIIILGIALILSIKKLSNHSFLHRERVLYSKQL
jgi:putative membrane protein